MQNYYSGPVAVGWFPTVVRIRLSQSPAGDLLAGAWAELGNNHLKIMELINLVLLLLKSSPRLAKYAFYNTR